MTRAYVAFAFLCIVFGTTFGAIKIEMAENWPPLLSAGLRFTIGGCLVLGLAALRRELRPLRPAEIGSLVSVGLTVTAATFGALYCAERVLPSSVCALLSATSPLFAVALAIAAKHRRFDRFAATGIVFGTAGVALVAGIGAVSGSTAILAAAAIVVSEFGFAWGLGRARSVSAAVPMRISGFRSCPYGRRRRAR